MGEYVTPATLRPEEYMYRRYTLAPGQGLRISLTSEAPVSVRVVSNAGFEKFRRAEPYHFWGSDGVTYVEAVYRPPNGGDYYLLLANRGPTPIPFTYRVDVTFAPQVEPSDPLD